MQLNNTDNEVLEKLQAVLGYTYKNIQNLIHALTHSSYANENRLGRERSNERLEFLGDAVLNIVVSEYLYTRYPNLSEGELTRLRASIVCEASLVKCAGRLELGNYLFLGKGEEFTGGRTRTSILSDAFEAVIGSIYMDGGKENAGRFIHLMLEDTMKSTSEPGQFIDYKTQLQEKVQKNSGQKVHYELLEEKGPDHSKTFVVKVLLGNEQAGIGEGRSKKEAEQHAASIALQSLNGRKYE